MRGTAQSTQGSNQGSRQATATHSSINSNNTQHTNSSDDSFAAFDTNGGAGGDMNWGSPNDGGNSGTDAFAVGSPKEASFFGETYGTQGSARTVDGFDAFSPNSSPPSNSPPPFATATGGGFDDGFGSATTATTTSTDAGSAFGQGGASGFENFGSAGANDFVSASTSAASDEWGGPGPSSFSGGGATTGQEDPFAPSPVRPQEQTAQAEPFPSGANKLFSAVVDDEGAW